MPDRVEVKCLAPFEWRFGWLKGVFVILAFVLVVGVHRSREGFDASIPLAFALVATFFGLYFWPSKVALLEDGLSYRRYGLFTMFLPYSKIRKVESVQRLGMRAEARRSEPAPTWTVYCALRLHLEDGETVDIGTGTEELKSNDRTSLAMGAFGHFGVFDRNGWTLRRELDARIAAVRDAAEPAPLAADLMRGERSVAEWLASLEAAAPAGEVGYRGADEALWRVLEDDSSPREARAGAALALRSRLDEGGRHRMRVVVESCESPKLRVAIETALDEEAGEPRLLHALEQASLPRDE